MRERTDAARPVDERHGVHGVERVLRDVRRPAVADVPLERLFLVATTASTIA
jgi:hypothetical protein